MGAKKKRQCDPYASESTEGEDENSLVIAENQFSKQITNTEKKDQDTDGETKVCKHANKSVNAGGVKRTLKHTTVGDCTQCNRARSPLGFLNELADDSKPPYVPVIWLCAFCGNQGCDRSSLHKHAFKHFKTPKSDLHCLVINTQAWTVWCYECDSEVHGTSSKKLDELVQVVKKRAAMPPRRSGASLLTPSKSYTNLTMQYSGSDSRLHLSTHYEDIQKSNKNNRLSTALESIPKVKGLSNLGNTCFFNSVMQCLAQTHFLTQFLDVRIQNGHRMTLPGQTVIDDSLAVLEPLELFLPEGGSLSLALSMILKDMHTMGKNGVVNPGHLFGIICKKQSQFQGYQQQDSHELLRCLLESLRSEEVLRAKKAILKAFCLSEKPNRETITDKLKATIKAYGAQANHTIIEEIFGGQLISTVFCESCHESSQMFEQMMDLSIPISDTKCKPRKVSTADDECNVDCFGRTSTPQETNGTTDTMSKREMKRLKNIQRKAKTHTKRGKVANNITNESIQRRMTEKRQPEDAEDLAEKEEVEKKLRAAKQKSLEEAKAENTHFNEQRQRRNSELKSGNSEDSEYDAEEDDNDDTFGVRKGDKTLPPICRQTKNVRSPRHERQQPCLLEPSEQDQADSERSSQQSTDDSPADSDADIEDNADSENGIRKHNRHPSIVVDPMSDTSAIQDQPDKRLVKSCLSGDHLSYNSASDTSERYFTAAAGDTMDELDTNLGGDNVTSSITTTNGSSGKADSVSISSSDTVQVVTLVDQSYVDELSLKVGELNLGRRSSSRDDSGSTETLNTSAAPTDDKKKLKQQWMARSLTTLAPRHQSDKPECSIMSCLSSFTSPELMMGQNKIYCEHCTRLRNQREGESKESVRSNASRQTLIFSPPAVLTLHLKRFEHSGRGTVVKVNKYVQFPFVLDIAPFTSSISLGLPNMQSGQSQVLYGLYGIVEHSGRLNSGHYVAYVRSRPLDPLRIRKQLLNLKPSNQFIPDKLIQEMSLKGEIGTQKPTEPAKKLDIEEQTEEVKQGRWFNVSDSSVTEVSIERVMKAQAYILFYERIV